MKLIIHRYEVINDNSDHNAEYLDKCLNSLAIDGSAIVEIENRKVAPAAAVFPRKSVFRNETPSFLISEDRKTELFTSMF
ncbi:hypothetical protein GCM10007854_11530 [Algimonas porphyrae]|uniref:Uncharacterized protein n=1 Tax=Algimonas porphyrae TaxID=1128113 RepID=A0ABQ5V060_9PROT|nr:hypothetical protein GCM10007854_11530 [Algimonas porphyrae]